MASTKKYTKRATITPAQIRAARALLDWSREELANRSGVSLRTLVNIENGEGNPKPETMSAIRDVLSSAGIKFIEVNGGGPGVRFRWRSAN